MVDKHSEKLQPFKDAATLVKTVNVFKGGSKVADKVVRIPTPPGTLPVFTVMFQADTQGKLSYAWLKNKREMVITLCQQDQIKSVSFRMRR